MFPMSSALIAAIVNRLAIVSRVLRRRTALLDLGPPLLLIICALAALAGIFAGNADLAIPPLFLALPAATGWVVLFGRIRRD